MDGLERKPSGSDSLSISMSSQNVYAELFNDRYKKLTQNVLFNAQETDQQQQQQDQEQIDESKSEVEKVADELNNAKKNRMYKDLGMNLNLKEIFNDLNYDELMKLKKLHVLYANQRARQKERAQAEKK